MKDKSLDNIAVVLVEPQGPLNVGAVARAMKNMGLSDLVIVGDLDPSTNEARLMASRSTDLLESARRFSSLDAALADRGYVVGTTARERHRVSTATPRDAAPRILARARTTKCAILFGREDHGLFKDELALCHEVISAPTSTERTSLNLAQAVLLVSYELFVASETEAATASSDEGQVLDGALWQMLHDEMVGCCADTGYLHPGNRRAIEDSMTRLLRLGPIQTRDARHLFGLLRRVGKVLRGTAEPRLENEPEPRLSDASKHDLDPDSEERR